jgi:hypothetical protein
MISKVEQTVEMSAITFRILTLSHFRLLRGILSTRVHMTFLLLTPDSSSVSIQREIYHASKDLDQQIRASRKILCKLRKEFGNLVEIRLYDSLSEHSLVIIDKNNADKAHLEVESRPVGSDSNSRPIDIIYRKENEDLFNQYTKEYDILLNNSRSYECASTL